MASCVEITDERQQSTAVKACSNLEPGANRDRQTAFDARFFDIATTIDQAEAQARVVAVVDDERSPRQIELRASLTADEYARAIVALTHALSGALKAERATHAPSHIAEAQATCEQRRQEAVQAAAEVTACENAVRSARKDKAAAMARSRTAAQAADAALKREEEAVRAVREAESRYGDHPAAVELIAWAASKIESFEYQKPHLPDATLAAERSTIRDDCERALNAFRYRVDREVTRQNEKIALLMLVIREAAARIPRGYRVAAGSRKGDQPPTAAEEAVWARQSEQAKRRWAELGLDHPWRWVAPGSETVDKETNDAVNIVITRVPELAQLFEQSPTSARAAQRLERLRASIRQAVVRNMSPRKPNPNTREQRRIEEERALHKLWKLPSIKPVARNEEAELLLPILREMQALPRSAAAKGASLTRAVMMAIQRGIEIREERSGAALFEKSSAHARHAPLRATRNIPQARRRKN